jgi:integrase
MESRKVNLTDRAVKALVATPGTACVVRDTAVPGLCVRVLASGVATFTLNARFPATGKPTHRAIGRVDEITLDWRAMLRLGKDPAEDERRARAEAEAERQAEQRANLSTFGALAEAWISEQVVGPDPEHPIQRKGNTVARDLRTLFVPQWGDRPITGINRRDVVNAIKTMKDTPAHARNQLTMLKVLFGWALDQDIDGLEHSPCADIKPKNLLGEKIARNRTLTDIELRTLWRLCERMKADAVAVMKPRQKYPDADYSIALVYQTLMLTGLRLNEAAEAKWGEFNLAERTWIIPAERMKGTNARAQAHLVPLTDQLTSLLETVPRYRTGNCLFSTTFGEKPMWIGAKIKRELDKAMAAELRREHPDIEFKHWVNHDIRRTVRSNLSKLKIAEEVREAVLAHARPGIKGVYDCYDYRDEKLEALTLWGQALQRIVEPPTDNVVPLRAATNG